MGFVKSGALAVLGTGHYDEVEVARRVLPRGDGFMVDVGAHRGFAHAPFADAGWDVLALEPDPANRAFLIEAARPTVTIDDRAITHTDGDRLTLYTSQVSSGISTLRPFHESHSPGVEVETVRLDTLLADRPSVDFLKVDTEGFDLLVLQTFPWNDQQPAVVVCEFEDRKTEPLGYTYRDLGDFLIGHGYSVLMSEWYPIVEYGGNHRWRRVISYPDRTLEKAAWGNFIAARPELADRVHRAALRAGRQLKARHSVDRIRGR